MYICIATYPRFTLAHPYVLNSSLSFNSGHSLLVYLISSKFVQPFVKKKQTYIQCFFHIYIILMIVIVFQQQFQHQLWADERTAPK